MLRAAIHGIGRWGMRLVESVQDRSGRIRFVRGVTRDPARLRDWAASQGITLTSSYAEVLRDPGVDAIVLATPHSQHHAQIVEAAQARKHLFVEKPFTLTRASAEAAVHACLEAGVTLSVGYNRRHAPAFLEIARRVRSGAVGQVLHLEGQTSGPGAFQYTPAHWRAQRTESPGGAMTARGVHVLDSMIQLAGTVTSVYAVSEHRVLQVDLDDTTAMMLRFSSGATGYLGTLNATADYTRLQVFGSKGWLQSFGDTDLTFCPVGGAPQRIDLQPADTERAVLELFADAAAAGKAFVVPPAEIVNGVAVLEAMLESAKSGSAVAVR